VLPAFLENDASISGKDNLNAGQTQSLSEIVAQGYNLHCAGMGKALNDNLESEMESK